MSVLEIIKNNRNWNNNVNSVCIDNGICKTAKEINEALEKKIKKEEKEKEMFYKKREFEQQLILGKELSKLDKERLKREIAKKRMKKKREGEE